MKVPATKKVSAEVACRPTSRQPYSVDSKQRYAPSVKAIAHLKGASAVAAVTAAAVPHPTSTAAVHAWIIVGYQAT